MWETMTPTAQHQEHLARLQNSPQHLWGIFLLDFHFPAVLMCKMHPVCLCGPWCHAWLGLCGSGHMITQELQPSVGKQKNVSGEKLET